MEAGAYVLGALAPADRSAYERHLATCSGCRENVAQLAGLPGLLGRLDTESAVGLNEEPKAPPLLLETMLNRARTERQRTGRRTRWRRAGVLLAAACLAVLAGLGVGAVSASAAGHPTVVAMSPVDKGEMLAAVVGYWPDPDGGTEISMACVYPATPDSTSNSRERLNLWVFPRDGGPGASVWSWDAGAGDRVTFWAETPLRPKQIGRMEIRRGDTVLLVYRAG
jgi:anti-sigma-K factor RskA